MKLDKNYSIRKDSYNFILDYEEQTGINPETGSPVISREITYHNCLYDALIAYSRKIIDLPDDVGEMVGRIKLNESTIKSYLKI